jgi:NADH-quinone oxidoreductase subunit J
MLLSLPAAAWAQSDAPGVPDAVAGGWVEALLFYLIAGGAVLSGLGVCVTQNIVRMAVWLFMALGFVALLYFLLAAMFLGVIQLIVYAGGTLVLLVFGVMLTSKSPWVRFQCGKLELFSSAVVCGLLLGCLVAILGAATWRGVETVVPGASVSDLGWRLLTYYLVPFEVAGVLLFVVMVGAAHLARQQGD